MDGPEPFHWLGAPVAVYGQFVSRKKDALMTPQPPRILTRIDCADAAARVLGDLWRQRPDVLVEGHTDLILLAPDDVTGDACTVRLKDKFETLGNVLGVIDIERRARNGNVTRRGGTPAQLQTRCRERNSLPEIAKPS